MKGIAKKGHPGVVLGFAGLAIALPSARCTFCGVPIKLCVATACSTRAGARDHTNETNYVILHGGYAAARAQLGFDHSFATQAPRSA